MHRLSLPIRRPSQRKYLRHAAISVMWVCWLPGTMWWIVSQHQPRESLYAIFLHMERLRLPSIQLPCFWKSATISAITVRLSMKAGGKAVRTGVFGLSPYRVGGKDYRHYRIWTYRAGTARIAQALGMKVLAYDAYRNEALENENCHYADLDELYRMSDVIALHCPLFPETAGMINKESIAKMKDGVIILNDSRGPLIVEEDLKEALNSGKVGAAGLDVVSTEPIKGTTPCFRPGTASSRPTLPGRPGRAGSG